MRTSSFGVKPVLILVSVLIVATVAGVYVFLFAGSESTNAIIESEQEIVTEQDTEAQAEEDGQYDQELSPEEEFWQDRVDAAFEPKDCETAEERRFGELYYDGPLVDGHWHIPSIPDSQGDDWRTDFDYNYPSLGVTVNIDDIICTLERENTDAVFAFFSVYKGDTRDHQIEVARRFMELYPDKFVPFIMPPDDDGSPDGSPTVNAAELEKMLEVEPGLFEGYGEIGLYARTGGGSAELPPDSQRLQEIYPIIRENKMVIYFHLGEGHDDNIQKVAAANRDITFVFHGDQLVKYENGGQNLEVLDEILYNNPNIYYEIDELYGDVFLLRPEVSKGAFLAHFDDYDELLEKDLDTWKGFIERHPDQVIWGTDRGWSSAWSTDEDVGITLTNYARAFIARLDPGVQEKYAYKNAEKIVGRPLVN